MYIQPNLMKAVETYLAGSNNYLNTPDTAAFHCALNAVIMQHGIEDSKRQVGLATARALICLLKYCDMMEIDLMQEFARECSGNREATEADVLFPILLPEPRPK